MSTPLDEFTQGNKQTPEQESVYPTSTLPQLPPEARGEVNGGPLGCCLGTMTGLLLAALLALGIPLWVANGGYYRTLTGIAVIIGAIIGGYIGWKVGKKIYREYDSPVFTIKKHVKKARAQHKSLEKSRDEDTE